MSNPNLNAFDLAGMTVRDADNAIKIEDDYYDNVLAILGDDFTEEEVELLLSVSEQNEV